MRLLDIFSGIGGFSLAASHVWGEELEIVGFCEIDKYAQKVLRKNFPSVPIHEDIKSLSGEEFKNIDLLTGGFPCQDISIAGKGEGLEGERSGLWFELLRLIRRIRPQFILLENVPMLTIRGGTTVLGGLTEIGYDCEWQIISAAEVGAPHLRKRIWIVAYPRHFPDPNSNGSSTPERLRVDGQADKTTQKREKETCQSKGGSQPRHSEAIQRSTETEPTNTVSERGRSRDSQWEDAVHVDPCRQIVGPPGDCGWWSTEPEVGRVANGVPSRVDRLRGLGNAIVPHCAAIVMSKIKEARSRERANE